MKHDSIMWTYMAQEEAVLRRLLADPDIGAVAAALPPGLESICFVAHGSSYNAAVATADLIARAAGLRVQVFTPANFLYNSAGALGRDPKKVLVALISQTGTSSGALEALAEVQRLGVATLGVTDTEQSPMAVRPDRVLFLRCGEEDSNAKTKGYSATLLALILLGLRLGRARGSLGEAEAQNIFRELSGQVEELALVQERVLRWCEDRRFGTALRDFYILGSGMNFGTALEGQLKLMETACIPTMFNDIGEFSHGMHRSITERSTVVLLRASHPLATLTEKTFRYLRGITQNTLLLDAAGDMPEEPDRILLPAHPLTQSLLLFTRAIQVLSVYGPEEQGFDPNRDAHNDFTQVVHTRV